MTTIYLRVLFSTLLWGTCSALVFVEPRPLTQHLWAQLDRPLWTMGATNWLWAKNIGQWGTIWRFQHLWIEKQRKTDSTSLYVVQRDTFEILANIEQWQKFLWNLLRMGRCSMVRDELSFNAFYETFESGNLWDLCCLHRIGICGIAKVFDSFSRFALIGGLPAELGQNASMT